jgi:hypothetical protein
MFFSFAGGKGSVFPEAMLSYFPGRWVGESPMVHDAHLFFCSFMQATLELASGEKWPTFFSEAQCREIFHGLGVQDFIV